MGFRKILPTFGVILLLLVSASGVGGQDSSAQDSSPKGAPTAGDPLLEEARNLSAEGKLQDAAGAYAKWLAENAGRADFGLILIEAADSQLSIERALELLRVYTPRVQDPRQQELCRASQIDLLEMLGRTEQALGLLRSFPPTPRWLYRQAQLLYQEGLAEEAEKSLEQALKALLIDENHEMDSNIELEARIRLLQARIYSVQDRHGEADNLFQLLAVKYGGTGVGPGILLAYYEYLLARGRNEAANEQLEKLARDFPDSPELALARAAEGEETIGYAPVPSRLLPRDLAAPQERTGSDQEPAEARATVQSEQAAVQPRQTAAQPEPQPAQKQRPTAALSEQTAPQAAPQAAASQPAPQPAPQAAPQAAAPQPAPRPPSPTALVQTGSFRDQENAEYMVRDLEASGFEAGIAEKQIGGTLYYRVVIGPLMTVDQAQAVLMKLKDAGYEGVLLFPE
jgi:cell division protein FtsN